MLPNLALELRLDVGEEHDLGPPRRVRQLGLEVGEHPQLSVERLALVEVPPIRPAPEERLPTRDVFDVLGVDPPSAENRILILAEVIADGPDDMDGVEE